MKMTMETKLLSVQMYSLIAKDGKQYGTVKTETGRALHTTLRVFSGDTCLRETPFAVNSGVCERPLFLDPAEEDVETVWRLYDREENLLAEYPYLWKKPRRWTIYVMLSSHTDIGLHNSQYIQRYNSARFLDMAADLCDAAADRDPNDRYRYTVEGSWFWENYPHDRGDEAAERILSHIRSGEIGVCAGIAGNHTQSYGFSELCHSAANRRRLFDRYGIDTHTMSMIDNNGMSWSIVQPYADAGYENIIFAPNQWNPLPSATWSCDKTWSDYTWNPEAGGGGARVDVRLDSALPMLFYWQGAQEDRKLLVWATAQYGCSNIFGFNPGSKPTNAQTNAMLARLTINLPKMEERYPIDVWLTTCYGDDQAPSADLTDVFARWNGLWQYPVFRTLGNPDEPFRIVRERFGDRIPTLRGEMTGGWYQHPAAAGEILGRKLNADRALAVSETASSAAALLLPGYEYPAEEYRRAWNALLWHDEHSYGTSGYQGRRVYETWMQHNDWIDCAERAAENEMARALGAMAENIAGEGVLVFNPSSHERRVLLETEDGCAEANVPACSYRTVRKSEFREKPETAAEACSEPPVIENRWYRIAFSADGTMKSVFDRELGRELLTEEGGANRFLYTTDNHETYAPPVPAQFTLKKRAGNVTVEAQFDEPVSGASVVQSVTLEADRKQITIDNRIRHMRDMVNTHRYYRYLYYGFPFAVENARRFCQLNGCEAEYARDLTGHGTDTYMQTHEWACAENGEFGVALLQRDTGLTEFDHIHPDKSDVNNAGEGAAMYSYIANDWLQMHLTGGSYLDFHVRYAIVSYPGSHVSAGIAEKAEDFVMPMPVCALPGKPEGDLAPAGSYLTAAGPARLIGLKRAEDGRGFCAYLLGSLPDDTEAAVSCPGASVCRVRPDEREYEAGTPVPAPNGYTAWRIDVGRTVPERRAPEDRTDSEVPAPIGSVYTGLITRPRAFAGEGDGHLYLLWGRSMEENLAYYELYRSEEPGFTPSEETLIARPEQECWRVGRYEDTGLKTHRAYYYRVRAVNQNGVPGPFSEEFRGITREPIKE